MYRAVINLDFTGQNSNHMTKLRVALIDCGWVRVETSAFVIESDDLSPIWKGVELVGKQALSIGQLSAFQFHIQLWDPAAVQYNQNMKSSHPNAINDIDQLPWP
jgi:hypothetical protein